MKMPFTLDAPEGELTVYGESGASVDRDEMLSQYHRGERKAVTFSATTYVHGPNKNHTRLNDAELEQFASSFKGQPFLSDHAREQAARGGTIIDSKLVEVDGKKAIRQTVKAVKPWAVEGVLDGTVDRFSIGWSATEYVCTACEKPFFRCGHGLEDLGELDEKSKKPIEVLMKGIEGMEVSAVTHPAVPGTGVLDALRQLKETVSGAYRDGSNQEDEMKEKVLSLLGMAPDTGEPEAIAALEARLAAPTPTERIPAAMLTVLELKEDASANEAIAAVAYLKAPGHFVTAEVHAKTLDELATLKAAERVREARKAGKITPAGEEWALGFAKSDPDAFAAFVAHAPVNGPPAPFSPITPGTPPAPTTPTLSEEARRVCAQMGVTEAEYLEVLRDERVN